MAETVELMIRTTCGSCARVEKQITPVEEAAGLTLDEVLTAVDRFPDTGSFTRQVTFLPSCEPNVGYVLLQLRVPEEFRAAADFREKRQTLLEIACGAAKNASSD